MKNEIFCWVMGLGLLTISALVFAHEMTGWMAPEEAKKMKNSVKATRASIQKGKEIYEMKCALCHGVKRGWKRSLVGRIKSKTNKFQRLSWRNDD